jgi:ABC-2 type transport system permease protein
MTWVLWRKLFRDVRLTLLAVALLLGLFQFLWARITERILSKLAPFFNMLAGFGGLSQQDVENVLFEGPGRVIRTLIGGDRVVLDSAMDLLSIGYVHPLMQILFCIWAIGRAAGAIAGELDRGTMELLLAQPLARSRLILAHFLLDLATIPLLCLSLWAGNWIGAWAISPIRVETPVLKPATASPEYLVEMGPFRVRVVDPLRKSGPPRTSAEDDRKMQERLRVEPMQFAPALILVAGLIFAVCGLTMWLSAAGRFRWRVLGWAVFLTLLQFLLNLLGQMWDAAAWVRPLTLFYYYQPQQVILGGGWYVTLSEWNGNQPLLNVPMPLVLFAVGLIGYLMALRTLVHRDIPSPI